MGFWIIIVLLLLSRGNGSVTLSASTRGTSTSQPVQTPLANGNLISAGPAVSSSPLTADQSVIGTIPSDNGPVPIVTSSKTVGSLLNIAQVWVAGVSHFVATYRDGSQSEVTNTGKVIGPWPPSDSPEESATLNLS